MGTGRRLTAALAALSCFACGPSLEERLRADTDAILALGPREFAGAGTAAAAELLAERFEALGAEVERVPASVPSFEASAASASAILDGETVEIGAEALAFAAEGTAGGDLIDVGDGGAGAFEGADVAGRVVLVRATPTASLLPIYERAVDGGAVGLLLDTNDGSSAPLRQRRTAWKPDAHLEPRGPAVGLSISDEDAARLRAALEGGAVRVDLEVEAEARLEEATTVVARYPGSAPSGGALLIGAHIDSWHLGANDNATSLAHDVLLVGFPGQEAGFFGTSQFARDRGDELLFAVSLDMLAPLDPTLRLASFDPFRADDGEAVAVRATFADSGLGEAFPLQLPASELRLTSGLVASDQSSFWDLGIPGAFLACVGWPEFHTEADLPERVDWARLVTVTEGLAAWLTALDGLDDAELGRAPVDTIPITNLSALGGDAEPEVSVEAFATTTALEVLGADATTSDAEGAFRFDLDVPPSAGWLKVQARTERRSGVAWLELGGS